MERALGWWCDPQQWLFFKNTRAEHRLGRRWVGLRGFTFAAPNPVKLDTYILKLDYKLTQSGNHSLFVKGHLENFRGNPTASPTQVQQFPGQPPMIFSPITARPVRRLHRFAPFNLVNNLRYGYIRQGLGDAGVSQ